MDRFVWMVAAFAPAMLLVSAAIDLPRGRFARMALVAASLGCAALAASGGAGAAPLRLASAACVPIALALLVVSGVLQFLRKGVATWSLLPLGACVAVASALLVPALRRGPMEGWAEAASALAGSLGIWYSVSLVAFAASTLAMRRAEPCRARHDFIVVPGAALAGRRPCPLLETRLLRAMDLWLREGRAPVIVVSGGRGRDEEVSEASAMRAYLEGRGVPPLSIADEALSTTTAENMRCSKSVMDGLSHGGSYRVAIATSEFHVARCMDQARRLGLDADAAPARTGRGGWLRSVVREHFAVTAGRWWPYAAILLAWAARLAG